MAHGVNDSTPLGVDAACPECGYSLRDLPPLGRCPECGTQYTPYSVTTRVNMPPQWRLALSIGWPLLLFGPVLTVGVQAGAKVLVLSLPMLGALAMLMAVYAPLRALRLTRACLPPSRRSENPIVNLWRLGPAPFAVLCVGLLVGWPGVILCGAGLLSWVVR
jgi:hypothetical protein